MLVMLINFSVGLLVSFLGSLPLGVLNITILDISLKKGMRAAVQFALACALVELVYSYVSVLLTRYLIEFPNLRPFTEVVAAVTLLGMGVYYLRKPKSPVASKNKAVSPFYLGLTLSLINIVAFPFWILYTTLLQGKGIVSLSGSPLIASYVLGIAVGAVGCLLVFAYASRLLDRFVARYQHRMDAAIGSLFIFLAACQFLSLWLTPVWNLSA